MDLPFLKMCFMLEDRTEAEITAVEALLSLANGPAATVAAEALMSLAAASASASTNTSTPIKPNKVSTPRVQKKQPAQPKKSVKTAAGKKQSQPKATTSSKPEPEPAQKSVKLAACKMQVQPKATTSSKPKPTLESVKPAACKKQGQKKAMNSSKTEPESIEKLVKSAACKKQGQPKVTISSKQTPKPEPKPTTGPSSAANETRKSTRAVKRTRRFISQSEAEENLLQNPEKKVAAENKVTEKEGEVVVETKEPAKEESTIAVATENPQTDENQKISKEQRLPEVSSAKKGEMIEMTVVEPIVQAQVSGVKPVQSKIQSKPVKNPVRPKTHSKPIKNPEPPVSIEDIIESSPDMFGEKSAILHPECMRHSRLNEMKKFTDDAGEIDNQFRAIEQMQLYQPVIAEHQQKVKLRRSKISQLVNKFRRIENLEEICDDFESKFRRTTKNNWQPFEADLSRPLSIFKYKQFLLNKKPLIQKLIKMFLAKKEPTQAFTMAIVIEMHKLLPDRPEVRSDFHNIYLPKIISVYNKALKNGGDFTKMKKESYNGNPEYRKYF